SASLVFLRLPAF
ncbi:hypothetical protein D046_6025B, partial [Vibrio parahaemolyticus V-223/04]